MAEVYKECDVLLKLSRVESFCYPAIEAMASGCLVITMKVDGGIDYLKDGWNSLILKEGSATEILSTLRRFECDISLVSKLRINGLSTARNYSELKSKEELLTSLALDKFDHEP